MPYNPLPTGLYVVPRTRQKEGHVMNPLDSIPGTIVTGLVLAAVLVFVAKAIAGA